MRNSKGMLERLQGTKTQRGKNSIMKDAVKTMYDALQLAKKPKKPKPKTKTT